MALIFSLSFPPSPALPCICHLHFLCLLYIGVINFLDWNFMRSSVTIGRKSFLVGSSEAAIGLGLL